MSALFLPGCKQIKIGENEAGVILNKDGTVTVYKTGETHFVFPLSQEIHMISTGPTVLSFVDEEGVKIAASKEGNVSVESQLSYVITDIPVAVRSFGAVETHKQIRNTLKMELTALIKEKVPDVSVLDDSKERIMLTAQIHLDLNKNIEGKGIKITSFQIRYR
jgi:hypothetical protein